MQIFMRVVECPSLQSSQTPADDLGRDLAWSRRVKPLGSGFKDFDTLEIARN